MLIKKIKRNSIFNLLGSFIAGLTALLSIPYLLRNLGQEKFALLSIIWTIIGYMSLMEFGIGKSMLYLVSKIKTPNNKRQVSIVINTGILINLSIGIILTIFFAFLTRFYLNNFINLKTINHEEAYISLLIAAISIIPLTVNSSLRNCQEALGLFGMSNLNKVLIGSSLFLLPSLSVFIHGARLDICSLYIVLGRILTTIFSIKSLYPEITYIYKEHLFKNKKLLQSIKKTGKELFSFGKWIALCNFLGPILVYGDKFVVSSIIPIDQLSFYTIPQELIYRILIIPASLCGALFPYFSNNNKQELTQKYNELNKKNNIVMGIIILISIILWAPFAERWISTEFAAKSNIIAILMLIGIFFSSIAQLPYTLIEASGGFKISALSMIFQTVILVICLPYMVRNYGLNGAAIFWMSRFVLDFVICKLFSYRFIEI